MHSDQINACSLQQPDLKAFKCQVCGACCRWPGQVRLLDKDIIALAEYLDIALDEFLTQWTTLASDRRGLILAEQADGACIFLDANRCRVYPARPRQCRDFPIKWSFHGAEKECPGARLAAQATTSAP